MNSAKRSLRVLQLQTDTGLSGGITSYISQLVRLKVSESVTFYVVAQYKDNEAVLKNLYGYNSVIVTLPITYSVKSFLSYVKLLRAAVNKNKIDIIHAHALRSAFAASLVSLFTGIPIIYTNHGIRFTQKRSLLNKIPFIFMELLVCWVSVKICSVRKYDFDLLLRYKIFGSRKLCLLETRIDTPCEQNLNTPINEYNLNLLEDRQWLFVGIGSLIEVKRPDRFLKWVLELKSRQLKFKAIWIGDGPMRTFLEERAVKLNLPLTFVGYQSRDSLFNILNGSDLLFLTSQFEVFPFVVLEAYSRGVPVISSRFDGVEDFVINNGTGLIVNADNAEETAFKISNLLSNQRQFLSMREFAMSEFTRRFANPELLFKNYFRMYVACANVHS